MDDTSYPAFIAEVGALAMGSATYEWMLRHADQVEVNPVAHHLNPWEGRGNTAAIDMGNNGSLLIIPVHF